MVEAASFQPGSVVRNRGRLWRVDELMAESFVSTLKAELVDRDRFPTREAARVAIFEYVGGFYNRTRRHSALGYESPIDYEAATMEEAAVA